MDAQATEKLLRKFPLFLLYHISTLDTKI